MTNVLVLGDGAAKSIDIQWVYPPADATEVLLANAGHVTTSA